VLVNQLETKTISKTLTKVTYLLRVGWFLSATSLVYEIKRHVFTKDLKRYQMLTQTQNMNSFHKNMQHTLLNIQV